MVMRHVISCPTSGQSTLSVPSDMWVFMSVGYLWRWLQYGYKYMFTNITISSKHGYSIELCFT